MKTTGIIRRIDEVNKEVIFKDKGISGIAIFNASSYINRNRSHKYKISFLLVKHLDFQIFPFYSLLLM